MHKRLGRFVPIIMLAILVQLLAPIAAMRVAAAAIVDPLTGAVICQGMSGSETSDHGQSGGDHSCCACCPLCTFAHAAAPIEPPSVSYVAIQRAYQRIVWLEERPPVRTAVLGASQQARAPPFPS